MAELETPDTLCDELRTTLTPFRVSKCLILQIVFA